MMALMPFLDMYKIYKWELMGIKMNILEVILCTAESALVAFLSAAIVWLSILFYITIFRVAYKIYIWAWYDN